MRLYRKNVHDIYLKSRLSKEKSLVEANLRQTIASKQKQLDALIAEKSETQERMHILTSEHACSLDLNAVLDNTCRDLRTSLDNAEKRCFDLKLNARQQELHHQKRMKQIQYELDKEKIASAKLENQLSKEIDLRLKMKNTVSGVITREAALKKMLNCIVFNQKVKEVEVNDRRSKCRRLEVKGFGVFLSLFWAFS